MQTTNRTDTIKHRNHVFKKEHNQINIKITLSIKKSS